MPRDKNLKRVWVFKSRKPGDSRYVVKSADGSVVYRGSIPLEVMKIVDEGPAKYLIQETHGEPIFRTRILD